MNYEMLKGRPVRLAKIKLAGQDKLDWTNVEDQINRAGEDPIAHWDEMKEKYLPLSYRARLLDQR